MSKKYRYSVKNRQKSLDIRLRPHLTFTNFEVGDNSLVISTLVGCVNQQDHHRAVYLWGKSGVGKSHLVNATLNYFQHYQRKNTFYLSFTQRPYLDVTIFNNVEQCPVIVLEDVHYLAHETAWQEQLFYLFNRVQETTGRLIFTATEPPHQLQHILPDLVSRFSGAIVMQVKELSENQKIQAFRTRVQAHGMQMSQPVMNFIFKHGPRDLPYLFTLLEFLDQCSLSRQQRLTIPLVKEVMRELSV